MLRVELDVAAQEIIGVDAAEHEVEVGHRGHLEAALAPAHADLRSGRVGSELGPVGVRVDAHERARAGADRIDLDQRQVEDEASDARRLLDRVLAVGDQRDVEARAADVGAHAVAQAELLGQVACPDHAADRSRDQRARELARVDRDRAAVRGHDPQVEGGARLARHAAHLLQLLARGLGRVGLDQRGVQAREVAPHRVELGGQEHRAVAVLAARALDLVDDLLDALLVRGVAVRVEQAHDDRLDALVEQLLGGLARLVLVERDRDVAEQVDALANALHQLARHERLVVVVRRDVQPVGVGKAEVGLDPALQAQVVLETARDDAADAPALALEQPVEHRRAGVDPRDDAGERRLGIGLPVPQRVTRGLPLLRWAVPKRRPQTRRRT